MLGEKQRNLHDVAAGAVAAHILPDESTWLELRSLRNRLTHEYDLASDRLPELITLIRKHAAALATAEDSFAQLCTRRGLVQPSWSHGNPADAATSFP